MQRIAILGILCVMAVAAGAQQEPAPEARQVEVMSDVVNAPLQPEPVRAAETDGRTFTSRLGNPAAAASSLQSARMQTEEIAQGQARVDQCNAARAYVIAHASEQPRSDQLLVNAALADTCFDVVLPDGSVSFEAQAPAPPPAPEPQTPLQTSAGVPLDLSQRAVLALTIIAVNTAKEAVINEGLGAFAKQICDDPQLAPYFDQTCSILIVGSVTKGTTTIPLRTLTLKQVGSELQDAMRSDLDNALPTLIADLSLSLNRDEQALLPVVTAAFDTLRTGDASMKGRVLARNILSNVRCPLNDPDATSRCALVQLVATAAATSLDTGCTDATACRNAFVNVVAAEALRRIQDWGVRNNVVIPTPPAGQTFDPNMLSALSAENLQKLKADPAFQSLVLWNGTQFNPQVYQQLATFVQANKPSTPTISAYVHLIERSLTFLEQSNAATPEAIAAVRRTLLRVDPRVTSTIDLALVIYRAAQALKQGTNALAVAREAAVRTPCDAARLDDFSCGFRFTGVVLTSLVRVEETFPSPLDLSNADDRKTFVAAVVKDVHSRLAEAENIGVATWATDRFLAYRANFSSFTDDLLTPVITLDASMKTLRALKQVANPTAEQQTAIDDESRKVVAGAFRLVRTSLQLVPIDSSIRERSIRVIGDVERGWVAVQKRQYAQVIDATLDLASRLCIVNKSAQNVISTIDAYRPLLEAFTAAETKEEFTTQVQNFIQTAPTAIDLQQFERSGALSMYVGAAAGAARLRDENGGDRHSVANLAPYVPVGIDFSWRKTWGAMLSLVDVGAVAALYVRGGESEIPEARLKNIFSPGLVVRKSWTGRPYAWGLSASMVPDLGGSSGRAPRVALFVAYQRPLLRIFPVRPNIVARPSQPCQ